MQPHESPRHDPRGQERERRRQGALTRVLALAIGALVAVIGVVLLLR
jgi:predicted nucleic acid-binding Zn ribbon protein